MFFLLPKATKHRTFQGPPRLELSIGHQTRCFPIGFQSLDSFQGPPSWGLPLPPFFSFSLKL